MNQFAELLTILQDSFVFRHPVCYSSRTYYGRIPMHYGDADDLTIQHLLEVPDPDFPYPEEY